MILLLNEQHVVYEVLSAVRIRAAQSLQIPHSWVEVRVDQDKHLLQQATYHPSIALRLPAKNNPATAPIYEDAVASGLRAFTLPEEEIQAELKSLMAAAKEEIATRLAGLDT